MKSISFLVEGNPLPKQSFRSLKRGHGYTPEKIKAWQNKVEWSAKEAMQKAGLEPFIGDVRVHFEFTRSNKTRVDFDNLSKAVCDAMNGIVYVDDSQITDAHIFKMLWGNPGAYIVVWSIE